MIATTRLRSLTRAAVVVICAAPITRADDAVAPAALEFTAANSQSNTLLRETGQARALQIIIARQQLARIPTGSLISALRIRLRASSLGPWPAAPISFTRYDAAAASAALTPADFSTTFAANQLADVVAVHTGALAIPASTFADSSTLLDPFATLVRFERPFRYDGQDLVLTIRHTGSSGAAGNVRFVDAVASPSPLYGGASIGALSATSADAATGAGAPAPVVDLAFAPSARETPVVVPFTRAARAGSTTYSELFGPLGRSYQMIIDPAQVGPIPAGTVIEGIRLRPGAALTQPWPPATFTLPGVELSLAQSTRRARDMSDAFLSNVASISALTLVRSGAVIIPAGALQPRSPSSDPAFADRATFEIPFATPYPYTGTPLLLQIRHGAAAAMTNPPPAAPLDALPLTIPGIAARAATGDAASTALIGAAAPALIVELITRPAVVIPSARLTALGGGGNTALLTDAVSQIVIGREVLADIPIGSAIDGLSLRAGGATPFPAVSALNPSLTVTLSTARTYPGTMLPSVAANAGADAVTVRSGTWPLSKNALNVTDPAALRFGPVLRFNKPFIYRGGELHLVFDSAGFPLAAGTPRLDAVGGSNNGVQSGFSTAAARTVTSTDGVTPVFRLHFRPGVNVSGAALSPANEVGSATIFSPQPSTTQIILSTRGLPARAFPLPITGLSFRALAGAPAAAPVTDAAFTRFGIDGALASAATLAAPATGFDANISDRPQPLRRGALAVPALSFGPGAAPTYEVRFDRPLVLTAPGEVAFTIRTGGWNSPRSIILAAAPVAAGADTRAVTAIGPGADSATSGAPAPAPLLILPHSRAIWRSVVDIADDAGNVPPAGPNAGNNEADYNAFFNAFLSNGVTADIADDAGNPLPSEGPNAGVNEGDYNLFFQRFFTP
ncbi:hypothetical protein BH11PLA1_BH11PLA1_23260 [soil metagenome]